MMSSNPIISYILDRRFLIQTIATAATYLTIRVAYFLRTRGKRYRLFEYYGIPGPKPHLLSGNFLSYRKHQSPFIYDEQLAKKYGKTYGVYIGDEPSIHTSDLDLLKQLFFDLNEHMTERTHVFIKTPLSHGILFARYHRWKSMRKILSPFFNNYSIRGSAQTEFVENSVSLMLQYLEQKQIEAQKDGKKEFSLDIQSLMKSTALHLISSMAIKLPDVQVCENEKNVQSLDSFLSSSSGSVVIYAIICPLLKPIIQFLANHFEHDKTLALIHRSLNKIIANGLQRYSDMNKTDIEIDERQMQLIDLLIKLHHEGKLNKLEVIGNVEAILFAGYDTTSTTLTYVFWVLSKYPEVQDKLRNELMAHGIESQYLQQVLTETMRLYPTVISFTTRITNKTLELENIVIPQGTRIVYNAWLIYRNPEIWSEPEKFDPERFNQEHHPCAFAPFGLNARKCLGYQLAMLEMKMITCDVVLRYRLKLISPQNLELKSYAVHLSKPTEKVLISFEKL